MADSLPDRIRRGDLAALADPALPLHLLADGPGAEWWAQGSERCARALWNALVYLGADGGDPAWSDDASHLVQRLRENGVTMVFSGLKRQVLGVMEKTGLYETIGAQHFYRTEEQALESISRALQDPAFDAIYSPQRAATARTAADDIL